MKKKNQAPSGAVAKQYFEPGVQAVVAEEPAPAKKAKKSAPAPEPVVVEPEVVEAKVEEPAPVEAPAPEPAPEVAPEPPLEDAQ